MTCDSVKIILTCKAHRVSLYVLMGCSLKQHARKKGRKQKKKESMPIISGGSASLTQAEPALYRHELCFFPFFLFFFVINLLGLDSPAPLNTFINYTSTTQKSKDQC